MVIRIPKTAELVAAAIRKMIVRGDVKEGDFLQPEAQLMAHFGTSRPTLREAFRILESERLISVSRGSRSGARVHAPNVESVARYAGLALQVQGTMLSDIYLARLALEPFAVRLLAERRTESQLAAFRAELKNVEALLERDVASEAYRVAVFRLHHSIISAAGSNTLTLMSAMVQEIAEQHMVKFPRANQDHSEPTLNFNRRAMRSFNKLFELLKARDADGAEAHWREHIRNANKSWLRGSDGTTLVDVLD